MEVAWSLKTVHLSVGCPGLCTRASERGGPGPGALGGLAGRHRGEILVSLILRVRKLTVKEAEFAI